MGQQKNAKWGREIKEKGVVSSIVRTLVKKDATMEELNSTEKEARGVHSRWRNIKGKSFPR